MSQDYPKDDEKTKADYKFSEDTKDGGGDSVGDPEKTESKGYWSHNGEFSVTLTDDAPTDRLPTGATIEGHTVRVQDGEVGQSIGGITMHAKGQSFGWGYKFIKEIRDGNNNLLWQNRDYKDK